MDSESYSTDTEEGIRTEKKRGFERGSRRGSYSKGPHSHTKCRIISAAENGADWRAVASANGIGYPFKLPMDDSVEPKICLGSLAVTENQN